MVTRRTPAIDNATASPPCRSDGKAIQVLRLGPDGRYTSQTMSRAFPGFPEAEAKRLLSQIGAASATALVKSFRHGVRANALAL